MHEGKKIVGLTGGIGSGKTFILEYIASIGFDVFSSDKAVYYMMEYDSDVQNFIKQTMAIKNGSIDKMDVACAIFSDDMLRKNFQDLLYPKINLLRLEAINNANTHIFCETPLLFENNMQFHFDFIASALCQKSIRVQRAMLRKRMTSELLCVIMSKQVHDDERVANSDFLIHTDISKDWTKKQVNEMIRML